VVCFEVSSQHYACTEENQENPVRMTSLRTKSRTWDF